MECCNRPNRSDTHLSREEEAKIEVETREHFNDLEPKRHSKPQRSEYSSLYVDKAESDDADVIPEYAEFQRLEHDHQKLAYNGSEVTEEFVETDYYKDLNCIDKQHHMTGSGFIKIDNANPNYYNIAPDLTTESHLSHQGNPATNDWIPAAVDEVILASDKPTRSDS